MIKRIGFLGPTGTYTEEATLKYDQTGDLMAFPTISSIGQAISSGLINQGVVPIENSLEGSVTFTLDLLISQSGLYISDEIVLPIQHYLLGLPGIHFPDIEIIYSHPQALAQCQTFLDQCFPKATRTASLSTVAAVTDMRNSQIPAAAIAPKRAAKLHNVEIIGQDIQDNSNNVTRFVVLAPQDHDRTGFDKTSICFSFNQDSPGVLYDVLGEFAERKINLAKIESRPTKELLGQYIFLVDCEGHREEPLVNKALSLISERANMFKILGSYPRWDS